MEGGGIIFQVQLTKIISLCSQHLKGATKNFQATNERYLVKIHKNKKAMHVAICS